MIRVPPTAVRARPSFESELEAKLAFEASRAEAQELRFPTTRCGVILGADGGPPELVWLSRERRKPQNGKKTYSIQMERGEQCPNEAVATRCIDGRAVHRCAAHPFPAAATGELARAS